MAKHPEMPVGFFAQKSSRQETKADATTTAARSILDAETKARNAKTAKLRALRLAQQEDEAPAPVKPKRAARTSSR